jgi:small GTP-binding protein
MIQKKLALLGAAGVGKTSLVRRFVESIFDDAYLSTIGVKVDKKTVRAGDTEVTLMIWDVAGAEEHFSVPSSYVKGASGFMLVADGTRPDTLDAAARIVEQMDRDLGPLPFILVLNKADLSDAWCVEPSHYAALVPRALAVMRSSAKTGDGVEAAFHHLAASMLNG